MECASHACARLTYPPSTLRAPGWRNVCRRPRRQTERPWAACHTNKRPAERPAICGPVHRAPDRHLFIQGTAGQGYVGGFPPQNHPQHTIIRTQVSSSPDAGAGRHTRADTDRSHGPPLTMAGQGTSHDPGCRAHVRHPHHRDPQAGANDATDHQADHQEYPLVIHSSLS